LRSKKSALALKQTGAFGYYGAVLARESRCRINFSGAHSPKKSLSAAYAHFLTPIRNEKWKGLAFVEAALEQEDALLKTGNARLKNKLANFRQQFASLRPKGELHPDAVRILVLLFQQEAMPVSRIAVLLGISEGMGKYHCDELLKAEMIKYSMVVMMGEREVFLTVRGRAYLVEHGHHIRRESSTVGTGYQAFRGDSLGSRCRLFITGRRLRGQ